MNENNASLHDRFYNARNYALILSAVLLALMFIGLSLQGDSINLGWVTAKLEHVALVPYFISLVIVYFGNYIFYTPTK